MHMNFHADLTHIIEATFDSKLRFTKERAIEVIGAFAMPDVVEGLKAIALSMSSRLIEASSSVADKVEFDEIRIHTVAVNSIIFSLISNAELIEKNQHPLQTRSEEEKPIT